MGLTCRQVLALDGFSRRNVFIMAISLAIGAGLNIVPDWGSNSLWNLGPDASSGVTTLRCAMSRALLHAPAPGGIRLLRGFFDFAYEIFCRCGAAMPAATWRRQFALLIMSR